MSEGISPIQPISRIEPVMQILGIKDMDPALYQMGVKTIVILFQKIVNSPHSTLEFPLPPLSILYSLPRECLPQKKRYNPKKNGQKSKKIRLIFKQALENDF